MNLESFWVLLFAGFIFFVFYIYRRDQIKKQKKLLEEQMFKRNGKVVSVGFFTFPKLLFNYYGYDTTLYSTPGGRNRPPYTYASSLFRFSRDVRLTLYSEGVFTKLGKLIGMQDIQIGNTEFDNTFIVKGSEEFFVKRFLTPKVQQKLLSLKDKNPYLQMTQDKLVLRITYIPKDTEDYDNFIDTALSLLESLQKFG